MTEGTRDRRIAALKKEERAARHRRRLDLYVQAVLPAVIAELGPDSSQHEIGKRATALAASAMCSADEHASIDIAGWYGEES